MDIIDNCINKKLENNIINEIIELITTLIPNINDSYNSDKFINLIINSLKSENEETRKSFEDALIRMCNILISKNKFDIISKLFEKIYLLIFIDKNENINNNLFNCFNYLLIAYNNNEKKFKLTNNIDIKSFVNEIIKKINPKLSNKQLVICLNI